MLPPTLDRPPRPGSVLAAIGETIGSVPRFLLRDTNLGEEPSPVIRPVAGDEPSIRYRIDGEIARGGMGAVLKGRDPDLGRDVAIKVLREDLRHDGELIRRFVEEAQIGGQLQHPGVLPIYELGTFADKRPFFSMKLVKGKTLADLLEARSGSADLPQMLSIYAAIAQTMAYAHTRGVIHRDLKPSNVMVGSFGEVQVMDWGLAKVLTRRGVVDDAKAGKQPPQETLIATARNEADTDHSRAGSVMGTPSYMAPEQARGETDIIDERADVFALGSILGEILTGSPAFTGRSSAEILRKAARGDTVDALSRLDNCGAEAELIALAKDCLAVEAEDRLHDAKVVAERITAYLAGVQERVHAAERERAVAVARAIEERRRRRVQLALAASLLAFISLGGISTAYYLQQRAERDRQRVERIAAEDRVVGKAVTLLDQARANPEDVSRWQVAAAAVEQAEAVGDASARDRLLVLHRDVQAGLDAAKRDQELLDRLVHIRSAAADDPDGSATDAAYADAFGDAGIDLVVLTPAEAGARIRARSSSVALALAAALDDWAAARRGKPGDADGSVRLGEAARVADPDPWRIELRNALDQPDKTARLTRLQNLANAAKTEARGAISLQLLGSALKGVGDLARAESVLRIAQRKHPGDVWVNYDLGAVLEKLSRRDEAIRFYTAARAIRPETAHELAHALERRGDSDEAIAVFRDLQKLRPGNARHSDCLGDALKARGLSQEAAEAFDSAVVAARTAIRLKPNLALAHSNLGNALRGQGKLDEAIAEFRAAIHCEPDYAKAHLDLGIALYSQGKLDEAIAEFRTAIRLKPDYADAHYNLGIAMYSQGKHDGAIAEYRTAIRIKPDFAEAHYNLGGILQAQGDYAGALEMYRKGHELSSRRTDWRYPSAQWVAAAERSLALANRLPAVLKGEDKPNDNTERLTFAQLARNRKSFAAAARLFAEALASDPKLGDDRRAQHRYNAAGAAALAAAGQGQNEPTPDDAAKAKLRRQALDGLRAELTAWTKLLETGPSQARPFIARTLDHWKQDTDLVGIRDADALAKLPADEREAWRSLWADIDALRNRAGIQ
jgi:eukaryotic-like serine/threonine-protein kinase